MATTRLASFLFTAAAYLGFQPKSTQQLYTVSTSDRTSTSADDMRTTSADAMRTTS